MTNNCSLINAKIKQLCSVKQTSENRNILKTKNKTIDLSSSMNIPNPFSIREVLNDLQPIIKHVTGSSGSHIYFIDNKNNEIYQNPENNDSVTMEKQQIATGTTIAAFVASQKRSVFENNCANNFPSSYPLGIGCPDININSVICMPCKTSSQEVC